MSSATGQGSEATFTFDSIIGGIITLPGGEVLLVSSGSLSGQGSLTGSNGSGSGGGAGGYAFGAGDAVVSIRNGAVVVVAGGGDAGSTSPPTTTTTLLPFSAGVGKEGVASATTASSLASTLTSSAAGRETSSASAAVNSGAGKKMGIGCADGNFAGFLGVVVLSWSIGMELL